MARYYSLNDYLKEKFGEKVYKLSLDLGLTCPNRDGTLDTRGCSFCLAGSSHFAEGGEDINAQLERAKSLVLKKTKAKSFIAYFQSYTNTYAPTERLKSVFSQVIEREDIVALSIATRPDCLPDEIINMLAELNRKKPIWVELGLQTANEKTAERIRRCYKNEVYEDAVKRLNAVGIDVITHVILGLPNETREDMLATVDFAVMTGTKGIKLQLLHVLRGTDLCRDYENGDFEVLSFDEYTSILFDCIRRLPKHIVVHRITGDAPKKFLVEPLWSGDKKTVMNEIARRMERENLIQGEGV